MISLRGISEPAVPLLHHSISLNRCNSQSPRVLGTGGFVMRLVPGAVVIAAASSLAWSAASRSEQPASGHARSADIHVFSVDKIMWQEGPPSLPNGALIAVLEGDPTKEGPLVFR